MRNLNFLNIYRDNSPEARNYMAGSNPRFAGIFHLPIPTHGTALKVIATVGMKWEHVSASLPDRCPIWEEMCWVKEAFFEDEEVVMQLHPKKSEYVNYHPFCLHLWRPIEGNILTPPSILVGPKGV